MVQQSFHKRKNLFSNKNRDLRIDGTCASNWRKIRCIFQKTPERFLKSLFSLRRNSWSFSLLVTGLELKLWDTSCGGKGFVSQIKQSRSIKLGNSTTNQSLGQMNAQSFTVTHQIVVEIFHNFRSLCRGGDFMSKILKNVQTCTDLWRKPESRDSGAGTPSCSHRRPLHPHQPSDLVLQRHHLPQGWDTWLPRRR